LITQALLSEEGLIKEAADKFKQEGSTKKYKVLHLNSQSIEPSHKVQLS
jgi:hypothetical protein